MTLNKRVTYTVWCDDGRYCDPRAGKTFVTTNKAEAVVAAKKLGWEIKPRYAARLPQLCEQKAMSVHEVSPEWISNPDNIFRFGGVLEWADVLNTATDVLDYLEKP